MTTKLWFIQSRYLTIAERITTYAGYIAVNFGAYEQYYGQCQKACGAMVLVFPELTIRKGYASTEWGERGHWWLTTADGTIIDPTAKQFPSIFGYREWVPGSLVLIGKCCNCGDEIWEAVQSLDNIKRKEICSVACGNDYTNYLYRETRNYPVQGY